MNDAPITGRYTERLLKGMQWSCMQLHGNNALEHSLGVKQDGSFMSLLLFTTVSYKAAHGDLYI